MNIAATILLVLAILGLVYEQFAGAPKKHYVLPLALALFVAGVLVAAVWQTPHMVVIH